MQIKFYNSKKNKKGFIDKTRRTRTVKEVKIPQAPFDPYSITIITKKHDGEVDIIDLDSGLISEIIRVWHERYPDANDWNDIKGK